MNVIEILVALGGMKRGEKQQIALFFVVALSLLMYLCVGECMVVCACHCMCYSMCVCVN